MLDSRKIKKYSDSLIIISDKLDYDIRLASKNLLLFNSYLKEIRDFIRPCQRAFKQFPGLIADGRDMGTVIFPEADLKIYLTAELEERAKRREIQLKRQGTEVNMRILLEELEARDKKDIERELSPLKPAADSFVIDTSGLSPVEVLNKIKGLLT